MGEETTETDETTEIEDVDEFEAAFNEAAEAREGAPDTTLPGEQHTESDKSPGDAGSTTGTTADGVAEETSAEADKTKAAGAGKDKPAGEEKPFDGWPQDAIDRYNSQLAQTNRLQHQIDSDSGRVSAFQKKVNDLESTINEIKSGSNKAQPTDEEITDAMAGDDAEWGAFKEDYPEVAAAIDKRFDTQQGEVDKKIETTLAPVIEKQEKDAATEAETAATAAYGEVAKDFPTWQDAVKKQEYHDWFATQPPGVQNLGESADPADASTLIGLYDDYRVGQGHPTIKAKPDPEPDPGVTTEADELAKRRAQQLQDGETIPSKSARVNPDTEAPDEFEAAFNAFAARKEAKNRR